MPVLNRIGDLAPEMTEWRRWLHRHPETGFDLHETSAYVAARLREIGVDEVHEGIGRTGIVAVIRGQGEGPGIGLRADMDALPMDEETGANWASETPGRMHGCGHDGHTAMLLGAAKYLVETRNFAGRAILVFQPAEEVGNGARAMVEDGAISRFGVERLYALHNHPGAERGWFGSRPGPIFASVDIFRIKLQGVGGHAAHPENVADPLVAAAALVQSLQTIVSRNRRGDEALVLSVTRLRAGEAMNVIPHTAEVSGTVRSYSDEVAERTWRRIREVAAGVAAAHGVTAEVDIERENGITANNAGEVAFAAGVAAEISGERMVETDAPATLGGEDFGDFLEHVPGAMFWLGQGKGPALHHPEYDFNDEIAPIGASFLARLVERAAPLA